MHKLIAAIVGLTFAALSAQASAALPYGTPSLTGADHVKFEAKAKKGKAKKGKAKAAAAK